MTGLVSVLGLVIRGSLGHLLTLGFKREEFCQEGCEQVQGHTLVALSHHWSLSFLRRDLGLSQNPITNGLLCSLSNADLMAALGYHGE